MEEIDEMIAKREAKLQKLKDKRNDKKRARETQILCIKGRLLDKMIELGTIDQRTYAQSLDKFLTRNYDRKIFGLSEKPEEDQPAKKKGQTEKPQPIKVQTTETTPAAKPDVSKIIADGKKLAEVGVKPEDFMLP